jgi:hypothetical protein
VAAPAATGRHDHIRVLIIPISLDLLAADGSVLCACRCGSDVLPVPNSHSSRMRLFSNTPQFTDAIQRAEFASSAMSDWHTLLQPVVEPG